MANQIDILSPVALGPGDAKTLNAALAGLRGKRLGIRRDRAWRSFEIFSDEIAELARRELGVADVVLFDPEARIGTPERESARAAAFARTVDAAIVGLGT